MLTVRVQSSQSTLWLDSMPDTQKRYFHVLDTIRFGAIKWSRRILSPRSLPYIYVGYAFFIGMFLVIATPPFQTPDSIAHFFRSIQVASGGIAGEKFDDTAGGKIDTAAIELATIYPPRLQRATAQLAIRAGELQWSGKVANYSFPNTAVYPPYTYLPQAFSIGIGRTLHLRVKNVYLLTCAIDLVVSVAITFWALCIAERSRPLLFSVALLPMTLSLYASVSQEVLLLPSCFLSIAYVDRLVFEQRRISLRLFLVGVFVLAACISARPPLIGLLLLAFHPSLRFRDDEVYAWRSRLLFVGASALIGLTMVMAFGIPVWTNFGPPHSIAGQLLFIAHNPTSIIETVRNTLFPTESWQFARHGIKFYFESFVGVLGWLDAQLDGFYYVVTLVVLCISLLMSGTKINVALTRSAIWSIPLIAAIVTILLIYLSLYLVWTPVGTLMVEGVQGRYFLAVAPIFALIIHIKGCRDSVQESVIPIAYAVIAVFPMLTLICVIHAIVNRFYI